MESTVKVHGGTLLPNEDGFCGSPLPVISDHLLNSGTFPINGVIALLYMHRDSILVITSSYCLSVLSQSDLYVPLGLSNVYLVTPFALLYCIYVA